MYSQRHQDVSYNNLISSMSEWRGLLRRVGAQENRGGRGGTGGKRKRSGDGSTKRAGSGKITRGRLRNNSA